MYGLEETIEEIEQCLKKAEKLLNSFDLIYDGNYAFICTKCAPVFRYYGYFGFADELEERAEKIYAGT